jgi:hypothetical protein
MPTPVHSREICWNHHSVIDQRGRAPLYRQLFVDNARLTCGQKRRSSQKVWICRGAPFRIADRVPSKIVRQVKVIVEAAVPLRIKSRVRGIDAIALSLRIGKPPLFSRSLRADISVVIRAVLSPATLSFQHCCSVVQSDANTNAVMLASARLRAVSCTVRLSWTRLYWGSVAPAADGRVAKRTCHRSLAHCPRHTTRNLSTGLCIISFNP